MLTHRIPKWKWVLRSTQCTAACRMSVKWHLPTGGRADPPMEIESYLDVVATTMFKKMIRCSSSLDCKLWAKKQNYIFKCIGREHRDHNEYKHQTWTSIPISKKKYSNSDQPSNQKVEFTSGAGDMSKIQWRTKHWLEICTKNHKINQLITRHRWMLWCYEWGERDWMNELEWQKLIANQNINTLFEIITSLLWSYKKDIIFE